MPEPAAAYSDYIHDRARALRANDKPPASLAAWTARRAELRKKMFAALGEPESDKACDLSPRVVATLKRKGYRIENVLFQSRPEVWVTSNVYIPEGKTGKLPAVLVVHGHWAGARRDPVVQARCLGLVKLGFVVLALDAFGAGERHPTIALGSYHGALLGSTLWPVGRTLAGLQVYDNRRAVDYLISRPEVEKDRLGVTGASGGGNQSMYAGALDERLRAVVPVCSVGTYQSYLKAACCVCEVLPGALTFTEEGDVLGLVAPRSLMVINATKDAFQFSVEEAKKSLTRAKAIFALHDRAARCAHVTFESGHAYSQPMREAMYGWMVRWLKDEGKGEPVAEPEHEIEKPEDLACYPNGKRPADYIFPSTFAAHEAKKLVQAVETPVPNHKEAWEARALIMRTALEAALGKPVQPEPRKGTFGKLAVEGDHRTNRLQLEVTPRMTLPVALRMSKAGQFGKAAPAVVLHLGGKEAALDHAITKALLDRNWVVYAPDLRATGELKSKSDAIAGAPDHNSAEHGLWIGEPLLGQWVVDVRALLAFMAKQPGLNTQRLSVVGIGPAGVVALTVAATTKATEAPVSLAVIDAQATLISATAYPKDFRMGLLAPGLLKAGDVPHLAALAAPRNLIIAGGLDEQGKPLDQKGLEKAYGFTAKMYGVLTKKDALTIQSEMKAEAIAAKL